jgi:hypothetical protein
MGHSKWPDGAQAIFMGAVSGTAFSVATYVDRKIVGYDGSISKLSVARLTAIPLLVAVILYMGDGNRLSLAPWQQAFTILGFVAFIAILEERARSPIQNSSSQQK